VQRLLRSGLEDLLRDADEQTYGGEDVTLALALKRQAGISVINCGAFYQHEPLKYLRMRAKGQTWVPWPLSRALVYQSRKLIRVLSRSRSEAGCSSALHSGKEHRT